MTSYLVDINVWLAMSWEFHRQHAAAARWYAGIGESNEVSLLFCRMTMLGLLRLLTNRAVMGDSILTIDGALAVYDRWMSGSQIKFADEPRGIDQSFRRMLSPNSAQPATKAIADCYLVGFAASVGAQVITFDKGLTATARKQHVPVALIRAHT